jgi:hypothetical protein
MKKTSTFVLFLCLIVSVFAQENEQDRKWTLRKNISTKAFVETVSDTFSMIMLEGVRSSKFSNQYGEAELPVISEIIEIPMDGDITVDIKTGEYSTLKLQYPIYPQQPPVSKSFKGERKFVYTKEAYKTNSYGNDEFVKVEIIGIARDKRYAKVSVFPVKYNPAKKTVRVYNNIEYELKSSGSASNGSKNINQTNIPSVYLIIADTIYSEVLKPFMKLKTKQGFNVKVAYTSNSAVGKTTTSIKNYIQQLYNNANVENPAPEYLLLAGDIGQIPAYSGTVPSLADGYSYVTDLYYACMDGSSDYLPDIKYGRFSANTVAEMEAYVNKTITIETVTVESGSYLDTALIYAGSDSYWGPSHGNNQIKYEISNYFNPDSTGIHLVSFLQNVSDSKWTDIKNTIQDGCSVVLYTAHGSPTGFASPSSFNVTNARTLNHPGKFPLVVGNCCLTGKFNYSSDCFAEAMMKNPNGGAGVFVGASEVTYWDEDFYWSVGVTPSITVSGTYTYENTGHGAFDKYFHTHGEPLNEQAHDVYEMIFAGNTEVQRGTTSNYAKYYWEVYHVFGDPSYMPYRQRPLQLQASFNAIESIYAENMQIQTEPYTRVALSKDDVLLSIGTADENGVLLLPINGKVSGGEATLYFTKQFYAPRTESVNFLMAEDVVFARLEDLVLKDSENNVTTTCGYGKEYGFSFNISNANPMVQMNKVLVKLSSTDKDVVIIDSVYTVNGNGSETVSFNKELSFLVSSNVSNNKELLFTITVIGNDSVQHAQKFVRNYLTVTPDVHIVAAEVPVMEPGENAVSSVTIKNDGAFVSENTVVNVLSSKTGINIGTASFNVGNLSVNDKQTLSIPFEISEDFGSRQVFDIILKISSGNRVTTDTIFSYTSKEYERFDSNDFYLLDWTFNEYPWAIDAATYNSAGYSAVSGTIGNNKISQMSFTANILIDDSISFYYKTSTEKNYDVLEFLIDEMMIGSWSGTIGWKKFAFPITKGEHTFTWNYSKDASTTSGQDRVWIDDIHLPIGSLAGDTNIIEAPTNIEGFTSVVVNKNRMVQMVSERGSLRLMFDMVNGLSGKLHLLSASGKRMRTFSHTAESGRSNKVFDVNGLSSGIYVCIFETAQGIVACKVIIQ